MRCALLVRFFTGFLIMLLLHDKVITKSNISSPLQLDRKVISKLPHKVVDRINEKTMLDVMTHYTKLKNYLTKYFEELEINNKINPVDPEDFIKYISSNVETKGHSTVQMPEFCYVV
jgi:hypothetical protein